MLFKKKAFKIVAKNRSGKKMARELGKMLLWYYDKYGLWGMMRKFREN